MMISMRHQGKSKIILDARAQGRAYLTEIESKALLGEIGIASTGGKLAATKEEAVAVSREIGFPVVLKVVSLQILHKSDAGGVKLGLKNKAEVGTAWDAIMASVKEKEPGAVVDGVAVQKMAEPGLEVIIGMFRDPQFGPVIMFGLGGVLVEILKDVSFGIVPLEARDAGRMIKEIKGYPLLDGYRGQAPADVSALEDLLMKVSRFADENPEVKEMDLNPVFAYSDGAIAVDARVVLETGPVDEKREEKKDPHCLDRAFNPRTVAVVGENHRKEYIWLRTVSTFNGKVYAVQPNESEWPAVAEMGIKSYHSLMEIPDPVDYVVVTVPKAVAPDVLKDCIEKKVGGVSFYTSGFAETETEDGIRLQNVMTKMAKEAGMNLIGPNCMGIFNPGIGLRHGFEQYHGVSGPMGIISQSGTHAICLSQEAHLNGIDVSKSVSFGNAVVLDSPDYLEYLAQDEDTKIIVMYIEGVKDGRRFFHVLRDTAGKKPVLIWKGGQTEQGARAAASHTGALAASNLVWETLVRQCGALSVRNQEELLDTAKALLYTVPNTGTRVGIFGASGGQSVAITDEFAGAGLEVPELTQKSYDRFAEFFQLVGSSYRNPVDPGANMVSVADILKIIDEDENVDIIVMELPSFIRRRFPNEFEGNLKAVSDLAARTKKPLAVIMPTFSYVEEYEAMYEINKLLLEKGIPAFPTHGRGARALKKVTEYYRMRGGEK